MSPAQNLITKHLNTWTQAIERKSTAGRGSSEKFNLVGIKKLRGLILEMAVRGLLVPQNPNDEPASVLLENIAAEKAQLIKDKKIKKTKVLPEISQEEHLFDSPKSWKWAWLNDLGDWGAGSTPKRGNLEYYGGDIPWFKSGELVSDFISKTEETVTQKALKECSLRLNKPGDVLIAMYGATIGKTSILEIEGTTNQAVCACTPFTGFDNRFLLLTLKAYKRIFTSMGAGGAQPNISKEKIIATPIAVPPLPEQKRIFAKVEELMALCDQLEQQTLDSIEAHQMLVKTLLNELVNPNNAGNIHQAWSLISENIDVLFTTEKSINTLKQTILQLAVMGKLVPQNSNDEPASKLIEKIVAKKAQLIQDGKIKVTKVLPEITDDEQPFVLPNNWKWVRLGDVTNYAQTLKAEPADVNVDTWVLELEDVEKTTSKLLQRKTFKDKPFKSSKNQFKSGDVIYGKLRPYLDKVLIADKDGVCTSEMIPIRAYMAITPDYLRLVLKSPYFIEYANSSIHGMNLPRLGTDKARMAVFPMSSPDEQKRIVTKADELIALCDQLKTNLKMAQTTQCHLAESFVQGTLN